MQEIVAFIMNYWPLVVSIVLAMAVTVVRPNIYNIWPRKHKGSFFPLQLDRGQRVVITRGSATQLKMSANHPFTVLCDDVMHSSHAFNQSTHLLDKNIYLNRLTVVKDPIPSNVSLEMTLDEESLVTVFPSKSTKVLTILGISTLIAIFVVLFIMLYVQTQL